jgi:phosphoglycolate phosphatase-like HAD superfamily hydrolase
MPAPRIRYVILDFDGTCTQVDKIQAKFLDDYRRAVGVEVKAWERAKATLTKASPTAGWTLMNAPSTAPAAADPYILAGEAAALLYREQGTQAPDVFRTVYENNLAPFRPELHDVIEALLAKQIRVAFISNSDGLGITNRIADLFHRSPGRRDAIPVFGGAQKFLVKEPLVDAKLTPEQRARFAKLEVGIRVPALDRPVYLRRGAYFEALCATTFPMEQTLVCGDIWELDLALPAALGAQVHLIERAAPFATYRYERERLAKGQSSPNLEALLERIA